MIVSDTRQERVLSVLPLFHIYGFNTILNQTVSKGIHLITMNKFTPEHYITALKQYKPTILFVVPSLLLFLASHPDVTQEHLSTVTNVMSGAAPAPKNLIEKFKAKVGRDLRVVQGYGMTESAPVTLIPRHKFPDSKVGSVGQITPVTEARVQDLTTREDLGPHQPGELLFRGPQVMLGYLNNEEATRQTLDKDGWLYTGDVGYYDEEGYFYIVDRTKELIKVKGNQIKSISNNSTFSTTLRDFLFDIANTHCRLERERESETRVSINRRLEILELVYRGGRLLQERCERGVGCVVGVDVNLVCNVSEECEKLLYRLSVPAFLWKECGKTSLNTSDQYLSVIGSPVHRESHTLDHATTKAGL
uniref:AMP-dependent synthetase/ligase domain-containing protein n=1 Tax=Timema bartmani TaxID=61472 RepID=A0A7R9F729_9NEOP|nr:unnamed protein product [Timema bartmani]